MRLLYALPLVLAAAAFAQDVQSAPMVKNVDPKMTKTTTLLAVMYPPAVYSCPAGFDMWLKNVKPAKGGGPEQNYLLFFKAPEGQIFNSFEGHQYKGMCLKGY